MQKAMREGERERLSLYIVEVVHEYSVRVDHAVSINENNYPLYLNLPARCADKLRVKVTAVWKLC